MKKYLIILSILIISIIPITVNAETLTTSSAALNAKSKANLDNIKANYPFWFIQDKGDGTYRFVGWKVPGILKSDNYNDWIYVPTDTSLTKIDAGIADSYPISDTVDRTTSQTFSQTAVNTAWFYASNLKMIETNVVVKLYNGTPLFEPIPVLDPLQHYIAVADNGDAQDSLYSLEENRLVDFSFRLPADINTITADSIKYSIGNDATKYSLSSTITYTSSIQSGVITGTFTLQLPIPLKGLNTVTVYIYDQWNRSLSTLVQMNNTFQNYGSVPPVQGGSNFGDSPSRADYPDGMLGDIQYGFSMLLYYIKLPFVMLSDMLKSMFTTTNEFLESFTSSNNIFAKLFSSLPSWVELPIKMLFTTMIVVTIVKFIRG